MRRRFMIAFNPGAGRSSRALLDAVLDEMRAADGAARFCSASAVTMDGVRAEIRSAALAGEVDAVVAAGGDGTIRQVAAALADTATPLGIVPLGTGNVLAHELALPRGAGDLARMLRLGPTREITLARANGEPFLLMAGAGFDGRVVGLLDQALKLRTGKFAYVPPALAALVQPIDRLQVEVDGRSRTATWVVAANARHYGGHFVMAPRTSIFEPGLSCILFTAERRDVLLAQLIALGRGRLDLHRDVEMIACDRVAVTAERPVPVQIDGDAFATTPLVVTLGDQRIALIVPD